MTTIQHEDARRLLRIVSSAVKNDRLLTYKIAAQHLGRIPPENHSRAVAQMCDLLDAAAALADVPLLALVQVRSNGGDINPRAWKDDNKLRKAIIAKSRRHHFAGNDISAISKALAKLKGLGNKRAWKYVKGVIPSRELIRRLASPDPTPAASPDPRVSLNAIDDIGTDTPNRAEVSAWSYARDPKVRAAVMSRAKGRCEYCGELGFKQPDGKRYLESHHIIALAKDGQDRRTNVIALCPHHHREAHFGECAAKLEKEMIRKVKIIEAKDRQLRHLVR